MRWSPKAFCRPGRLLILTVLLTAAGYFIFSGAFREPAEPAGATQIWHIGDGIQTENWSTGPDWDEAQMRRVARDLLEGRSEARSLPPEAGPGSEYYILTGFGGDGTWAVWSGGWLMDQAGSYYAWDPDWTALTADWEHKPHAGRSECPHIREAASMFGRWDRTLMSQARPDEPPAGLTASVSGQGDSFTVILTCADGVPTAYDRSILRKGPSLEVYLEDIWYRLPVTENIVIYGPIPAEPRPVLQPERVLTMSFSVSRLSAGLIPGRYRALLYGTSWEFTVP